MSINLEGSLQGQGLRIGVVVARFNQMITSKLLEGACEALQRHGVKDQDVTLVWVPGSFEVPQMAKTLADTGRYDALVCLGAVVKGETDHYEHIAREVAQGVTRVALDTGVPVLFGVLTTDNMEQALTRAGGEQGNKGFEAAVGAIEMANLVRQTQGKEGP